MTKLIILLCMVAFAMAEVKNNINLDRHFDLFKYNPGDIYTLPEDIDDDKPAVFFSGDVMKAKTEKLQNLNGNKKFKLDLKTQNGIELTSVGKLKDEKTFVVSGSYSFTGADGKRYKTRYTADEFGYHPITELDLDIPEPQPSGQANKLFTTNSELGLLGGLKNRFQFLNQNFNTDLNSESANDQPHYGNNDPLFGNNRPLYGSSQSGDDYSYFNTNDDHSNGYDYTRPQQDFKIPVGPALPSRQYLPVA